MKNLETFARTVHPLFFSYWDDFNQNLSFLALFFIKRQEVSPFFGLRFRL